MPEDGQRRGIVVTVGDERGRPVRVAGLAKWLARVAPRRARGHVSVALVSDRRARALNRTYRGKDYVTDVLSFSAWGRDRGSRTRNHLSPNRESRLLTPESGLPTPDSRLPNPEDFLGEIVIARGVASRQGRAAGHGPSTELRVLALHGLLHLLGYDHERDNGEMRSVELRLRRKGGLREGLIERTRR